MGRYRPRENRRTGEAKNLNDQRNEDTGKDEVPRQIAAHNAFNDHLHQRCLRCRQCIRTVAAPSHGQQVKRTADGNGGNQNADQLTDLLLFRGSANRKPVLRS